MFSSDFAADQDDDNAPERAVIAGAGAGRAPLERDPARPLSAGDQISYKFVIEASAHWFLGTVESVAGSWVTALFSDGEQAQVLCTRKNHGSTWRRAGATVAASAAAAQTQTQVKAPCTCHLLTDGTCDSCSSACSAAPAPAPAALEKRGVAPSGAVDQPKKTSKRQAPKNRDRQPTPAARSTSSRFRGVTWHKKTGKWSVNISLPRAAGAKGRQQKFLGYYLVEEEAGRCYDQEARKYYTEETLPQQHHGGFKCVLLMLILLCSCCDASADPAHSC